MVVPGGLEKEVSLGVWLFNNGKCYSSCLMW